MKRYLFLFSVVLASFVSQAQEADTIFIELYGVGGGYGETPDGQSLSYSMGELMVNTSDNFMQTFTNGFQQYSFEAAVGVIEVADENLEVNVFPNPTTEFLNITIASKNKGVSIGEYDILFFDVLGQQISLEQTPVDEQTIRVDLKALPTGMYMTRVMVKNNPKEVSTFKVTKTSVN